MAERAARLARSRPVAEVDAERPPAVVVRAGGELMVLAATAANQVLSPGPVTRVPPRGLLLGLRNVRGRIVPVADLGQLVVGAPPAPEPSQCPVVVVDTRGDRLGLLVEEARIADVAPAEALRPPPGDLPPDSPILGLTPDGMLVLDVERVVAHPHLAMSADQPEGAS